jgi:LCP family protein required for cell wall assembly
MNEWPDGWFRQGPGSDNPAAGASPADPTVDLPVGANPPGQAGGQSAASYRPASQGAAGHGAAGQASPGAAWPAQPPPRSGSAGGGASAAAFPGPVGASGTGGGRRWLRPRRIIAVLAVLVSLALILAVGMYFFLDSKLTHQNVLVDYAGRPAASAGQNWLITGSDSRQGLTRKQERQLATGRAIGGQRSDTILILHVPSNGGQPVLISLPRDSYVAIPGYGMNKLNAAYSFGGPKLLAETVQNATGLRIDHYMGIGFGGFVNVVDAVGGVRMCIKRNLRDPAAGLHLRRGCQVLDGAQALGYVRTRHLYANQDLQRIQDQRLFLRALLTKLTSTGTLLNPFAAIPAGTGAAETLTVDQSTGLYQLIRVAFALRHPQSTTVPVANASFPTANAGDALLWSHTDALRLFSALKNDQPVPRDLITGSHQAGG